MTSAVQSLALDLDRLAIRTWDRVRWGPQWNMPLREDGITDENLFQLRRNHPFLNIRKFSNQEEASNGADWEWWLGSDEAGWVGLRIQAKKMTAMRYGELLHRTESQNRIQCQVLIEETNEDSMGRALFPLYCFYNGWDETSGWPSKVPWSAGCAKPAKCRTVPEVRIFGCGIAMASDVLEVLRSKRDPLNARHTLPLQRPWSWLLRGRLGRVEVEDVTSVFQNVLAAFNTSSNERDRPTFDELPEYAEATRLDWPQDDYPTYASAPTTYVLTTDLSSRSLSFEDNDHES